ncbi:conserved phage C-terminal domain-containing protein [bacterium]|nr:conserved phage C-terminal domain-containing protein [Elusimicrobiota bacterium]MBR6301170.1 conserved phage C-terminal domain-containing protein [bacterium]
MLLAVQDLIGSETASAQRSREYRAKQNNQKMLQCNNNEIAMQQQREKMKQKPNVEIEIEKEIYKDISKDISCLEKPNSPPLKTKKAQNLKAKVKTIIDYLNAKLNTRYKAENKKTLELVNARLKEGFTIDDFKNVIDKKTIEWVNDPSMYKYLRPVTLFSTKFESYLNQPAKKPSNKSTSKFQNFKPREYDFEEIERLAMED